MKISEFRRTAACLAAALFIGGAWAFHMAEAHNAADKDCQVCAVSCSPELNADCGTELIAKPENFSLVAPALTIKPANTISVLSFYGRAPPLV
jgi:hypothetical protein